MKLAQLHEDTNKSPPPAGSLGNLMTTKQVADQLGVEPSRIRQLKGEGRIHPEEGPVPGHQESLYSAAEVERAKRQLEKDKETKMGRPTKGKSNKTVKDKNKKD